MAISSNKQVPGGHAQTAAYIGPTNTLANPIASHRARQVVRTPDLCVIGAGSGGLSVAAAAAALGVSVVLIEKHKMGGDCLNYGCIPSKALIASAKRAQQVRTSAVFGVAAREPDIDFAQVRAHVSGVIAQIAPNDSVERFTALGVEVIKASGRFINAKTVEAGDTLVRARRFVIASGSSPAVPEIPGLATVPYFTNESIFDLDQRVGHLVILGGGAIGIELAQAYRRLGAQVTILEADRALAKDDPELTAVALKRLRAEGVVLNEGATVRKISGRAGAIAIEFGNAATVGSVTGTHLLIAAGRKPNIDGLGLQAAGIKATARGIAVNGGLLTSNRRVYAIGDVTGGAQFTHVANYHASIVIRRALFRLPSRVDVDQFPRVTFTDPEIAQVGLTEAEARARGGKPAIYRWPFRDNDRAAAECCADGLIKVVCDGRGRIVGAGIAGPNAGELIQVWSLALSQRLKIGAMTQWTAPYPTLGEISKRAAFGALAEQARRPIVRKLLSILRKFG